MRYHSGPSLQRGHGIGSFFSGLIRGIIPLAKMGAQATKRLVTSKAAKKLAKSALTHASRGAADVMADVLEGENMGSALQKQVDQAKLGLAHTLRGQSVPSSSNRKRKSKKKKGATVSVKRRKKQFDLFA